MLAQEEDYSFVETELLPHQKNPEDKALSKTVLDPKQPDKISKTEIRSSLRALSIEGVMTTVFSSVISGVLVSKFLLDLGAGSVEIGMLASIPLLTNLLQPLGAYIADRTSSRYRYAICTFGSSRLLWLILVPAIGLVGSSQLTPHQLLLLTLAIIWVSNILEALGRASFLSWLAVLVPSRMRGRYFGFRNSIISLTSLIGVALLGLVVSKWPGGTLQGFGAVLVIAIVFGVLSLVVQFLMTDVNPHLVHASDSDTAQKSRWGADLSFLKDANFLKFLLYSSLWNFAVYVCAAFFNLYLLDNLNIDVSVVTLYNSLGAGANLLMLMFWGKLADRVGNRPLMIVVGVLVSLTPLLWLEAGTAPIFLWVWFPFLHLLSGATWGAIELWRNNLMMSVTPLRNQSIYFAIAAAVPGITGAMGITLGGFVANLTGVGGLSAVFALSAVLRLVALLPLVFVREQRSVGVRHLMRVLSPRGQQTVALQAGSISFQPIIETHNDCPPASSSHHSSP